MNNMKAAIKWVLSHKRNNLIFADRFFAPFTEPYQRKLRKKLIKKGYFVFPHNNGLGAIMVHYKARGLTTITSDGAVCGFYEMEDNVVFAMGEGHFVDMIGAMDGLSNLNNPSNLVQRPNN